MLTLLAKFTATVCLLLLLGFLGITLWLASGNLTRQYAEYRQYQTVTCGNFIDALKGADAARTTAYLDLFTAPATNLFLRRELSQAEITAMPSFRSLLATCTKQRAYTLMQAIRVTRQTEVAGRIHEVMEAAALPPAAAKAAPATTSPSPTAAAPSPTTHTSATTH